MIDLFSTQFQWKLKGNQNGKKTWVGVLTTFLVALVSFSYLGYLIYKLQAKQLLPRVTEITKINSKSEIQLSQSPFSVQFFTADNVYPSGYNFNNYFEFQFIFGNLWVNPDLPSTSGELCKQAYSDKADQYAENEYCAPKDYLNLQSQLNIDKVASEDSIFFQLKYCVDKPNCVQEQDIVNFLNNYQVVMLVKFRLNEFDYKEQKLKDVTLEKYIVLDPDKFIFERSDLKLTNLFLDNGFILSNYEKIEYLSSAQDVTWDNSKTFAQLRFPQFRGKNLAYSSQFTLSLNTRELRVEYVKFTEILAQFSSVFQVLMIAGNFKLNQPIFKFVFFLKGVFAKFCSEAKLFEQIIEIHLKYYYQKVYKSKCWNQNKDSFDFSIIKSLKYYILNEYFPKVLEKQLNQIENKKNEGKKIAPRQCQENFQIDAYSAIYQATKQNLELDQLYKEILQLKTYVQLLYSEEEYAAVKFTGRRAPSSILCKYDYNKIDQKPPPSSNSAVSPLESAKQIDSDNEIVGACKLRLNHLEKIDLIDRNEKICRQKFLNFCQKEFDLQNQNELINQQSNTSRQIYQFLEDEQLNLQQQQFQNPLISEQQKKIQTSSQICKRIKESFYEIPKIQQKGIENDIYQQIEKQLSKNQIPQKYNSTNSYQNQMTVDGIQQ